MLVKQVEALLLRGASPVEEVLKHGGNISVLKPGEILSLGFGPESSTCSSCSSTGATLSLLSVHPVGPEQ